MRGLEFIGFIRFKGFIGFTEFRVKEYKVQGIGFRNYPDPRMSYFFGGPNKGPDQKTIANPRKELHWRVQVSLHVSGFSVFGAISIKGGLWISAQGLEVRVSGSKTLTPDLICSAAASALASIAPWRTKPWDAWASGKAKGSQGLTTDRGKFKKEKQAKWFLRVCGVLGFLAGCWDWMKVQGAGTLA